MDKPADDAVGLFSGYVEQLHGHYQDRPDFLERLAIWRPLLDTYAVAGGRTIDLGCGTGVFSFYAADRGGDVIGVDGAPGMIAWCERLRAERGLANLRFVQARLPSVDVTALGTADLVISSSVLEYVEDLEQALAVCSWLTRTGGTLIVSMPNLCSINRVYERLKYRATGEPSIYRFIRHFSTPDRLARRVQGLGLTLVQVRHYMHGTRLARLTRRLRLPAAMTEDLFVAVFQKR